MPPTLALKHALNHDVPVATAVPESRNQLLSAVRAVLPIFLVSRLGVLVAGYFAVVAFGYPMGEPRVRMFTSEFWNLPFRYDVGWYYAIATSGYHWDGPNAGQQSIVFFPALPWVVRLTERAL